MEPIDYETEDTASLSACASLQYEDRVNSHLTQERMTHDQRIALLNIIRSRKKVLMESLQTKQRHVMEMVSEKRSLEMTNSSTAETLRFYSIKCRF